jgi:glycosyltransferase involved in cell wall biosynthesis
VGKLLPAKRPGVLLRAFAEVRKRHECHLVFVGDGALRQSLEGEIAHLGIPDVHITGFVNQSRMPEMYGAGDILVMPSEAEQWGLAVNEAMASGLAVIASDQVGSAPDLIRPAYNGFVFPHNDAAQLAGCLRNLVCDRDLREKCRRGSRELIRDWSVETAAEGIVRAAASAAQMRRVHA